MPALAQSSATVDRPISEQLSHFALDLRFDQIPAAVRERAKHLILDSVGIALASTKYPFAAASLGALQELGTGRAAVIGSGRRPASARANSEATPCDSAQIWRLIIKAGGRLSGANRAQSVSAARRRTSNARSDASRNPGSASRPIPASNIAE